MSRALRLALALLLAASAARADVDQGLRLLRQARQAVDRGDSAAALVLLDQAYVELPFSEAEELVYHGRADALTAEGRYAEALVEYRKALHKPAAHRARFNSGVLQHTMAEAALEEAGVPLDPAAIPEQADPAPLIAAIEQNLPLLRQARLQFMEALRLSPDAPGRESVIALTGRIDDLQQMLEDLQQRQDEQDQADDDKDGEQDQDQQGEQQDDEQQQDQQQDGDQPPDQPPEDQPPEEGEQDQPPPGDPQDAQQPPQPQPRPELTPAELADLLEQLQELEQKAMELDRQRRAQEQAGVEKDW